MKNCIFFLCLFSFIACGKNEETGFQDIGNKLTVTGIYDINNTGTGSDIMLKFKLSAGHGLTKLSAFVLPGSSSPVTVEAAATLPADRIHSIPVQQGLEYSILLNTISKDINGQSLSKTGTYKIMIYQQKEARSGGLSSVTTIHLKDENPVSGDYTGIWNDKIYKDFAVSLRMTDDKAGFIFYSDNFKSCCKGIHDGTVSLVISGKTISSVKINQYLENYNGGHCETTYTATGQWNDDTQFVLVNITGSDCDGNHTPGTATFTKKSQ